jgi:hypothetical protein
MDNVELGGGGGGGRVDEMMMMDEGKIVKAWNLSRNVVYIYFLIFSLLLATYYFLQHAIRYIDSTDVNCAAPGVLQSELWGWDFILQGLYALFLIPFLVLGFTMLLFWYERIPYIIFGVYCLLITAFFLGAAVYLSIQASKSNTCAAVGNPFNDRRICGVCGTFTAWITHCYNQAPYNPPVNGKLTMNWPKSFQLGYTWVFFAFLLAALFYVPTQYRKVQESYKELQQQKILSSNEPSTAPATTLKMKLDQPLLSKSSHSSSSSNKRNILK